MQHHAENHGQSASRLSFSAKTAEMERTLWQAVGRLHRCNPNSSR